MHRVLSQSTLLVAETMCVLAVKFLLCCSACTAFTGYGVVAQAATAVSMDRLHCYMACHSSLAAWGCLCALVLVAIRHKPELKSIRFCSTGLMQGCSDYAHCDTATEYCVLLFVSCAGLSHMLRKLRIIQGLCSCKCGVSLVLYLYSVFRLIRDAV